MFAVERLSRYISKGVYTVSGPFHPFGGAVDVIVVQQPDGSFKSSPWYVRFGKFQGVLKTREKVVDIEVNGVEANFHMYLSHKGEAYFLKEVDSQEGEDFLCSSPRSCGYDTSELTQSATIKKCRSCDLGADQPSSVTQIEVDNEKIVLGTNSNGSPVIGFTFGQKHVDDGRLVEEGSVGIRRERSLDCAEVAADLLELNWSTKLSTNRPRLIDKDLRANGSVYGRGNINGCNEVSSPKAHSLQSLKQNVETPTSEEHFFHEVMPESNIGIKEINIGNNAQCEEKENIPIQYDIDHSVKEESEMLGTPSETLETTSRAVDISDKEHSKNVNLPISEFEETEVHPEVLCGEVDTVKITNSQPGSGKLPISENVNDSNLLKDGDSLEFPNNEIFHESKEVSFTITTNGDVESHTSVVSHLVTSESVESEVLEVVQHERKLERFTMKSLVSEQVRNATNQSQLTGCDHSCESINGKVAIDEPSAAVSHFQVVSDDHLLDSAESRVLFSVSSSPDLTNQYREEENRAEGILQTSHDFNNDSERSATAYLQTELPNTSFVPSDNSEEYQFLFSDIDNSPSNGAQCKGPTSREPTEIKDHELSNMNGSEESSDINHKSSLCSAKLSQDCSPNTLKPLTQESNTSSSPVSIIGRGAVKNVELVTKSLPSFQSHFDSLEGSDARDGPSLSHSLGSTTENLKWTFGGKDISSTSKRDLDSEHLFQQANSLTVDDVQLLEKLRDASINCTIETSLCKHLLYEGMGVDAAAEAFDAEKVDFEKFVSLAPDLVKNDRLIVRVYGRYLPWDAAAPVISGMASFGHEDNADLKGMIEVDHVEKTFEVDTSKTLDSSGGSWRIWPFTFTRSKSMNSVRSAPDGTKGTDAESALETNSVLIEDKTATDKRKVKALVPTSEQLATLNLNEGQNVVKFTYSTAMLGKQQVDARIYLWKWNSRIVVSDVDGTITKSDVLGQFMPLVGKDWSQTGVVPLFSAIKDNGYQLLFLSARSISQAYITRQFLLNLNQSGKALPAGPVVISPDGLFPSLFREETAIHMCYSHEPSGKALPAGPVALEEDYHFHHYVIRRAPHEFKIACLSDIKALFPPDCNPFYAGFGNRDTDEFSYLKVGIPKGKIFIINPKGEVAINRQVDTRSYTSIHTLVNGMFPPVSSPEQEEFNSWNYWRMPVPDINI